MPGLHRTVSFPVEPDVLWDVLTEPSSASSWLGYRVHWELEPGAPAHFEGGDDGDRRGRIEEVVPGRFLRFRWWPEDAGASPDAGTAAGLAAGPEEASEVVYDLEPAEEGTRLTVTEERVATDRPRSDTATEAPGPTGGPEACAGAPRDCSRVPWTMGGTADADPVTERWAPWDDRAAGAWCVVAARVRVAA